MVRFKNRYLVCEVVYTGSRKKTSTFTELELYKCIRDSVIKSYGDYGYGVLKSSLSLKHWNKASNIVLIRAKRGSHAMVQSAITFVRKICSTDACFNTLHIGGTIRSCYKFLVHHHQRQLPSLLQECQTEKERSAVRTAILSSNSALKHQIEGSEIHKKQKEKT
ncbi:ribonuclease P/MRP protein subunit POP5-like [Ylistrum balloti]|uniref:ribonuclease P/MRP protein subunit POP5-like n=1 Tax=Ylistrum balloti TaxID=509963 RepID=UPI00290587C1|nr:ribonuclease P/MRP protein subunit POP5-like [Ylistrum balloti]